jgi:hypothetical protein
MSKLDWLGFALYIAVALFFIDWIIDIVIS